jgi:hypothetical protein
MKPCELNEPKYLDFQFKIESSISGQESPAVPNQRQAKTLKRNLNYEYEDNSPNNHILVRNSVDKNKTFNTSNTTIKRISRYSIRK